ncbi:MAG: glutaredoxin [Planctomycetes bacterium]|nr:glutaredoxin [Planctomycetota bacterium]
MSQQRTATLYRMVTDQHVCPYGIKSKHLLERQGYQVDDRHLENREQTDRFKQEHGVKTTPQTFIDGERVGGHDDLLVWFGKKTREQVEGKTTTYQPVVAVFATAALMAAAAAWAADGTLWSLRVVEWFVAFSMCVLAILKLRDLESFSTQFLGYDLLARRDVRYAWFYPFAELAAGVLMIAGVLPWVSGPLALFIGAVGAVSVVKAVYVDGRELKCACVGGQSNVPLGAISLTENVMMVAMGIWALA